MNADGVRTPGELLLSRLAELYELPEDWPPRCPTSAGDLAALIAASLPEHQMASTVAGVAFLRLRQAIAAVTESPLESIGPETQVDEILPRRESRACWEEISLQLGWRRPLLTQAGHDKAAFVTSVALAPISLALSSIVMACTYLTPRRLTMRELVRHLMAVNRFVRFAETQISLLPAWLAGSRRPLHPERDMADPSERIWYVVRHLIGEHSGQSPEAVRPATGLEELLGALPPAGAGPRSSGSAELETPT